MLLYSSLHCGSFTVNSATYGMTRFRILQIHPSEKSKPQVQALSGRVLFGGADQCHHRSPAYQIPLVAMAGCYAGEWFMHNLRACEVLVDGKEFSSPAPVKRGQTWSIGTFRFLVEESSQHLKSPVAQPRCTVMLEGNRLQPLQIELPREFLLGTATLCDFSSSHLASRHCLFTRVLGEWYVHDLTGNGGEQNGNPFATTCRLSDGDEVDIGAVKFQVRCPDRPPSNSSFDQSASAESVSTEPPNRDGTSPRSNPGETARLLAQAIYNQVKTAHTYRSSDEETKSYLQFFDLMRKLHAVETDFASGNSLQALGQLRQFLDQYPFDRQFLLSFARMCDSMELYDIAFYVLQLMRRLNPQDSLVLRSSARLAHVLGQRDPRFLKAAVVYWNRVAELFPYEAQAIRQTVNAIEIEAHLHNISS